MAVKLIIRKVFLEETLPRNIGTFIKGDPNPLWGFVLGLIIRGYYFDVQGANAVAVAPPNDDFEFLTVNKVVKLCKKFANNGYNQEVQNWSAFVKISGINTSNTRVPKYLANPFIEVSGVPTTTRKKWKDWAVAPRTSGVYTYVELNSGGSVEPGSNIAKLKIAGYDIMTPADVIIELTPSGVSP